MKKFLYIIALIILFAMPVVAEENTDYTILVGTDKKEINTDALPYSSFYQNKTLMVPLRKISEALGYEVEWNSQNNTITVDDNYIQRATLYIGKSDVDFDGKLKVINMSRKVNLAENTIVENGCTYVPLEFFNEFMNDTKIEDTIIYISPSMYQLEY